MGTVLKNDLHENKEITESSIWEYGEGELNAPIMSF
jgi:hypothetical protein